MLPDEVASQIAAGEVVERPASAVKELLENSLDAGASQITIRIEEAGRRLIEVADDGAGITREDLQLAVARHATSKLSTAADLFHIVTLGFRGEALASIGSVARMTVTSRTADMQGGARIRVDGGIISAVEEIGAPGGTVVRVEDLFHNVPARLAFLKQDSTERRQIDALVTRYALAYPQVRFHLFQDGRPVLQTSGGGNRREVLASLYGVDEARQMLEIALDDDNVSLSGFISPVGLTRSNRKDLTFFVNGRWVQDAALSSALLRGYQTLLMVGRYPVAAIFVQLDPEMVDVNVHPAKAEVRFKEPDRIFTAVQRAVKRGLLAYSPAPSLQPVWNQPQEEQAELNLPAQWSPADHLQGESAEPNQPISSTSTPAAQTAPLRTAPLVGGLPLLRLVGQVGNTYLVAEGPDGLYLIDQHAAHERVLFERFLAQRGDVIPAQSLLEPVMFQLPPDRARLLGDQIPTLDRLGFQVEPFGSNTFRVRAIPAFLGNINPVDAVRVVVEDFEEDETPLQAELDARLAARVCKRAAVKGGQVLSSEEQKALVRDLEACQSPRTCPHGRPTMIHLSVDLLERQFGRRGSR